MSAFATVLFLIPPFTPILMLIRQTVQKGIQAWQQRASVGGKGLGSFGYVISSHDARVGSR
jgi:ABC-type Na+ efflux pump permease subunit